MATIKLSKISIDPDLQPRAMITEAIVDEYAEAMSNGETFPPIIVFYDGEKDWLADGYHRVYAARKAGLDGIDAEIRTGTKRDALKFSLSANAKHGLRRSHADKRKAVLIAIREFGKLSNRELARILHVDDKTVGKYRERLAIVDKIKDRIANGESFVALNSGEALLIILKMSGPYVKMAYVKLDASDYIFTERGVHLNCIDLAVCCITQGLGLVDFDGWDQTDADRWLMNDFFPDQ